MLSIVAAVKAPRTHNRRRVTGSSGRRREGREGEPQRPNMSRHVFAFAVLLLVVMMCCCTCGAAAADGSSGAGDAQLPQEVDLFVPQKTQVVIKSGGATEMKDSFGSPSFALAGEVMVAFAEGHKDYNGPQHTSDLYTSEIVAGYINATEPWSSIVADISSDDWRAYTVFNRESSKDRFGVALLPTAVSTGSDVFLLVGSYYLIRDATGRRWNDDGWDIHLLVGKATQSTDAKQGELIEWGAPTSLLASITESTRQRNLMNFVGGGGSGIVTEEGWLVFPMMATRKNDRGIESMLFYSKDKGVNWDVSKGIPAADCVDPRIAEWENRELLMLAYCVDGQKVFRSRDMGTTWTKASDLLPRVWITTQAIPRGEGWRVGALITVELYGRKVLLYTQKVGYPPGERNDKALYLWVADSNHTVYFGPLSVETGAKRAFANTLLYYGDALYLLQGMGNGKTDGVFLFRIIEELGKIKSIVRNWIEVDAFFSGLSTPTNGLVGVLSDSSDAGKWNDMYRCVDATVLGAIRIEGGFKFTGHGAGGIWPVNSRGDNKQYTFVDSTFTLVATVVIEKMPPGGSSVPLLGAMLEDGMGTKFLGLACAENRMWETVFDEQTGQGDFWVPKKEYQVALMLNGNEGYFYLDAELLGTSDTMRRREERAYDVLGFYFGGDESGRDSSALVKNVFLYNRKLTPDELKMVKKTGSPKHESSSSEASGSDSSAHECVYFVPLVSLGLWALALFYGV
ncbi:putative trans-sialidase, Group II [Trypanosoma cruzi]|nr:putative trans-sialidase, Group II [Trypanosoma cruzi]